MSRYAAVCLTAILITYMILSYLANPASFK